MSTGSSSACGPRRRETEGDDKAAATREESACTALGEEGRVGQCRDKEQEEEIGRSLGAEFVAVAAVHVICG